MIPHSYTYNPGVVLDPLTMTPMITHGGNITVNPLGVPMRPEQKVWQKMFIKNIPQECSNDSMQRLLNEFGNIKNFKRTADNRGRLLPFCHFQLETGEEILRVRRLFVSIKLLDKILDLIISPETQNFLKEWNNMQKDEWKKKLQAPGMNEAKQYDSLETYHLRDDRKYKQRIEDTLKIVNNQVKKVAAERMREEERKQHPRQKERQRAKRKANDELQRMFQQKEEQVLRRERQKQKQYRKERERERERQKQRIRKVQKQTNLEDDEIQKKAHKYLTSERRRMLQNQQNQDVEIMMAENPPEPEDMPIQMVEGTKKVKAIMEEEIQLGNERVQEMLVEAPRMKSEVVERPKQLNKNELFEGYEQLYYEKKEKKEDFQLLIPEINEEVDKEEETRRKHVIKELEERVPRNKMELWQFNIDWQKLSKSVVLQRNIRPWLEDMSLHYMGGIEQKFIALVEKKLLSRSHPDKIIKVLTKLLDNESQQFVIRLWQKLCLEYLKLQNGLV